MSDDKWNTQYEQLNERSRWYSSQLWYIPFAYVGIVGLGIEKIQSLPHPLDTLAYLMLSIFSFAVYVHVVSLKFYERRAVRAIQAMENPVVSGGGSPWHMSFASYMKIMLIIGSYAFLWTAAKDQWLSVKIIGIIILTIGFLTVWIGDRRRTKSVLDDIRKNMKVPNSGTNGLK